MFELNEVLVPIDFSPGSLAAFSQALNYVSGDEPVVIALHVLDPMLAQFAADHQLGGQQEVLQTMRARAESELSSLCQETEVRVETIVSEGIPFLEIIRKAKDFQVDAVIMGRVGTGSPADKLLFGSTADKVLRGCGCPVVILPPEG